MVFATSYLVRNEYTEFTQPRQLFPLKNHDYFNRGFHFAYCSLFLRDFRHKRIINSRIMTIIIPIMTYNHQLLFSGNSTALSLYFATS